MSPAALLDRIRMTALDAKPYDELTITENNECKAIHSSPSSSSTLSYLFQQMSFSSSHTSDVKLKGRVKPLSPMITTLQHIFGTKRLERNLTFIKPYCTDGAQIEQKLSVENYETLLHCLYLTTKYDHEELLSEIQSNSIDVRGITEEALEKFRKQFAGKTIDTCSKADIATLESILLPFSVLKDLFLNDASHTQTDVHAPPTFAAMMKKAAWGKFLLQTREECEGDWEYIFGKVFSPPLLPEQMVLPHKDGYIYLNQQIDGGGASLRVFSSLGTPSADPIILARSTRCLMPTDGFWDAYESVKENLRVKAGSYGCIAISDKINALMTDPKYGFTDKQFRLVGYSQGGAHIQGIAALWASRVKSVATISSVAPPKDVGELFRKAIAGLKTPIQVRHMIDVGDIVPLTGEGELLCAKDNIELSLKVFMPLLNPPEDFARKNAWDIAWKPWLLPQYLNKWSQAHSRLTVAESHKVQTFTSSSPELYLLCKHDPSLVHPSWEQGRQKVCFFPSYDCPTTVDKGKDATSAKCT